MHLRVGYGDLRIQNCTAQVSFDMVKFEKNPLIKFIILAFDSV